MQRLTDVGMQTMERMAGMASNDESGEVSTLLEGVPSPLRFEIDEAIGRYVSTAMEAAFLAGLGVAANPLGLLIEG